MGDILNTGSRNTLLDDSILNVYSTTTSNSLVLTVDPINNKVGINIPVASLPPTVELDTRGAVAISSALRVQTNKLVVDSSGNVGIGTNPSGIYRLEIVGNTVVTGTLQTFGPLTLVSSTTFQTTDPTIVLNQGGNDASASASGIRIKRSVTDALLTWNNAKNNFEAGLSGSTSSLIRSGGNNDAAQIAIGTNDGYSFSLKANNVTGLTVSSTGSISVPNNLTVNGTISIAGIPVQTSGLPPGAIVAFFPGYFTSSSNTSFTATLTTNNITSINSWLSSNGFSQWAVCDGSTKNVPGSVIFNGAGRNLPNITDLRFAAGTNFTGSTGGTNSRDHTHNIPTALSAVSLTHTHTLSPATIPYSPVSFSLDAFPAGVFTGGNNPGASQSYTGTTSPYSHTHSAYSHQHPAGQFYGRVDYFGPSGNVEYSAPGNLHPFTANYTSWIDFALVAGGNSVGTGAIISGSTSGAIGPGGPSASLTTSSDLVFTLPFTHYHVDNGHTHAYPHSHTATAAHTHGPGAHTHNVNPATIPTAQFSHNHTTGSATQTENRPQYLSCVYIMRTR